MKPTDNNSRATLGWSPIGEADDENRFVALVQETFTDAQDVPELANCQTIDDMLAGYQATGDSQREHWSMIRLGTDTIGCLLLSDHHGLQQREIVYIGLLPQYRGCGYARLALQSALKSGTLSGQEKWIVAVDSRNLPAKNLYLRCGFQRSEQRYSMIRLNPKLLPQTV